MEQQQLTSEHWRQVKEVFQSAIELAPAERNAYLDDACAGDLALRIDVESLIAAHERPGSFLDSPALEFEPTASDALSLVGKSLGHYRILELLGRGGVGEVYKAKDDMLGREVAVKVLPSPISPGGTISIDPERLHRFVQEARAASALNHPNIITIHEFGQEDGVYFIVTEFIEGQTLRRLMDGGRIEQDQALDIAIQIAGALNAAHEAGIVHRDLKPENVMARPDGLVKVLDFGLAKLSEGRQDKFATVEVGATRILQSPTRTGVVMGTVNYMSPEQARGQKLDARTDFFSLGVMLYEMIADRSPFARETMADTLASILEKEPPPLAPEVPESLERVIAKALRKDRDERYQTAKALLADLKSLKSLPSGEAAPSAPRPIDLFGAVKRRWRIAAAAIVTLAALIAGGVYDNREQAIESIAVLPFANVGEAPGAIETDYLADSITETLINDLSRFSNLKVRPRNSIQRYKGRNLDPQAAGRGLEVEAVLTGEVAPRGNELIISLELIDVRENRRLWGARYQRPLSELLPAQAEITREVTDYLRLRLPDKQQPLTAKHDTENNEAYQAYLRGRYFWNRRNKEGFAKAAQYFNQAIEIDPRYALAYSGLADCRFSMAVYGISKPEEHFAKSKEAAKMALALDDTLAEAHTTLAHIAWLHDWDWAGAERGFKRAIELKPDYPTAHQWYAIYLSVLARHKEAIAEVRLAQKLDPFSIIINLDVARVYLFARQYDQAIEQSLNAIEMDQGFGRLNNWLKIAYEQKGMYGQAVEEHLKSLAERGTSPERLAEFKQIYDAAGWPGYWRKHLELTEDEAKRSSISPYFLAGLYARTGRNEQALECLEKARDQRSYQVTLLKVDPLFDRLRGNPRFTELLRDLGLAP